MCIRDRVETLHGQVIRISPSSPHRINPMDINLNSVSYTHLDVYKRQTLACCCLGMWEPASPFSPVVSPTPCLTGMCPVSYTHLDVYKRQGLDAFETVIDAAWGQLLDETKLNKFLDTLNRISRMIMLESE